MLVDLQVRTDAARLLLYRTAWLVDQGISCVKGASLANLYGFTLEFDIQRHFRDARLFVIGDGSSQIQRNLVARMMRLGEREEPEGWLRGLPLDFPLDFGCGAALYQVAGAPGDQPG